MKPGPAISMARSVRGRVGLAAPPPARRPGPGGWCPARLAVDQGDVGGPVAVLPAGGALEVDVPGPDGEIETALGDHGGHRGGHGVRQLVTVGTVGNGCGGRGGRGG